MNEKKNASTMEEANTKSQGDLVSNPEGAGKQKWSEFVERTVVDFFDAYKLEKMTVEDGNGNKAKISRTKDNELKIEQSSTTII